MRVISARALREFAARHRDAEGALRAWRRHMEGCHAGSLAELRRTFGSVDYVSVNKRDLHIFDIGGNKYRLIVAIHYKSQMVFIRHVLTHADYDAGGWRQNP
jgi:mRNA interferase HigB